LPDYNPNLLQTGVAGRLVKYRRKNLIGRNYRFCIIATNMERVLQDTNRRRKFHLIQMTRRQA